MANQTRAKYRFLWRNLWKGLLWLGILVVLFVMIKDSDYIQDAGWLSSFSEEIGWVYGIFLVSEIVFGIIPPELFMMWSLHEGISEVYAVNVMFLAAISYASGVSGYFIGRRFSTSGLYKKIHDNFLYQYKGVLRRFSGFIVVVGAITPLPFSGMCMLVGTIDFPANKFYLISLTRFLRYAIFGYIVWQANAI
ncbi:MAG: hypothetical protein OEY51_01425 [Cyclobacteriaceae bacterium]|nr:hypothetical protein [Cyclobacteriaceae bacterium]